MKPSRSSSCLQPVPTPLHRCLPTLLLLTIMCLSSIADADAQPAGFNYDESKVPVYVLPDPLVDLSGNRIETAQAWKEKRRPEVLDLFRTFMFGHSPPSPSGVVFHELEADPAALGGLATRKQIQVRLQGTPEGPGFTLLLYIPNRAPKPVPAFVGLNFQGNHTIHADPGIRIVDQWKWDQASGRAASFTPGDDTRGTTSSRWPVEMILERGYALVTAHYGDIEPDYAGGWQVGIRNIFRPKPPSGDRSIEGHPDGAAPDDWSAIGAWAWALSRVVDYCEQEDLIDARALSLLGHSRLGKTSLWAGAQDQRWALVISNNSGCGGAALSRRRFGETVQRINTSFPHWFCLNFREFNDREDALPLDQHMLIGLIAPRPVYIASAEQDLWADPRGEFLSGKGAEPVYALFGKGGLGQSEPPALNQPVGAFIGYHIRSGKHDVTSYDWEQYLAFADRHLR